MAQNENLAAIENAVAQMNSGNLEGYLEMYGDDLTLHGYPPEVQGKEGVSAFYAASRRPSGHRADARGRGGRRRQIACGTGSAARTATS